MKMRNLSYFSSDKKDWGSLEVVDFGESPVFIFILEDALDKRLGRLRYFGAFKSETFCRKGLDWFWKVSVSWLTVSRKQRFLWLNSRWAPRFTWWTVRTSRPTTCLWSPDVLHARYVQGSNGVTRRLVKKRARQGTPGQASSCITIMSFGYAESRADRFATQIAF